MALPEIRDARSDDFDAWFEVDEAVVGEGQWMGREPPLDREDSHDRFDAALASPGDFVLVAELDGAVAGGLVTHHEGGRLSFGMFVAAAARGAGVGGALLDEFLRRAEAGPYHKAWLQVWPHNEAAIGLYRSRGFVVEGTLRGHYRRHNGELWDIVFMGRPA